MKAYIDAFHGAKEYTSSQWMKDCEQFLDLASCAYQSPLAFLRCFLPPDTNRSHHLVPSNKYVCIFLTSESYKEASGSCKRNRHAERSKLCADAKAVAQRFTRRRAGQALARF